MHEEVIARRREGKTLADGTFLEADAKLYQLGGNSRPYFSVTATHWQSPSHARHRADAGYISGGQLTEEVREHFPELAPVVALHLSDDEGVPMHAAANAAYYIEQGDTETAARLLRVHPEELPLPWPQADDPRADFRARLADFVDEQRQTRWKREAAEALAVLEAGSDELEIPAGADTVFDAVELDILEGPDFDDRQGWAHNRWKLRLRCEGRTWTFPFRTGVAIERPELGDVLSSLISEATYESDEYVGPATERKLERQRERLERLLGDRFEEAVRYA